MHGKTQAMLEQVVSSEKSRVYVIAPTHACAEHIFRRLVEMTEAGTVLIRHMLIVLPGDRAVRVLSGDPATIVRRMQGVHGADVFLDHSYWEHHWLSSPMDDIARFHVFAHSWGIA